MWPALALLLQLAALEKQAYQAYYARDWTSAARLYESFHASAPGTAASWDNQGVALTNLGRWKEAQAALLKAVEINPQHRWAYNHLGFVYREQGRYQQAVDMFQRQIEISPQDPYAYRNLAATLAILGRLEEAEEAAATHEKYTYERGTVYIDMACNLNALHRPEQAQKYLGKAEAAGVERSLLAQESAHYYLTLRDYRRAEQQYRKMLEYQPYEPVVALRLGTLYWQTGNLEKAAAAFARVLSVDANDQVKVRTSANTSKTVSLADLRRNPAEVLGDVPLDLGRAALLVRGDLRELLAGKNPAPAEAALRDALGVRLLEAGRFADALDELQRAYTLAPDRRLTAYHLGVALEKSGQPEKALDFYTRSL
ncbi:MAG: tetratricopeptide repeat protein, partial [Acidobacteria bacterium]|nr:tetratricopeptide repeat protein [Acidobacteriota bacterium]